MSESASELSQAVRFPLVGEMLAVDLVNTDVVVRNRPIDLLAAPGAYDAWWRTVSAEYPELDKLLPPGTAANSDHLSTVTTLRQALRNLFCAIADRTSLPPASVDVLNRALEHVRDGVALEPDGATRPLLIPVDADGPLAASARSAFMLLTCADRSRLRRCANERCVLLFYDTTKSATRRWCSTHCMNRARSSARYRLRKGKLGAGDHKMASETDLSRNG